MVVCLSVYFVFAYPFARAIVCVTVCVRVQIRSPGAFATNVRGCGCRMRRIEIDLRAHQHHCAANREEGGKEDVSIATYPGGVNLQFAAAKWSSLGAVKLKLLGGMMVVLAPIPFHRPSSPVLCVGVGNRFYYMCALHSSVDSRKAVVALCVV